jgi:pimeloyl-ACP methyl ester carboxylesterase
MKKKIRIWIYQLIVMGFGVIIINGCKKNNSTPTGSTATDYSQSTHWLSLPATVYKVDVFYLYPTAWSNSDTMPVICTIDNASMLIQAPQAFARQATAFDSIANIYAPFYRQDNSSPVNRWNVIADIPTSDATRAFDYYIKHFNNGRPFILLGHSQGATILTNLLSGYLKNNPQVYAKMIAAYVIGSPVTQAYLNQNIHLKFATGPDDTGVIISWNTEAPDVTGVNPVLYGMVGLVINPINWKRDQTQATMAEGLGSLFPLPPSFTFVPVPQCADARVDTTKGVLISNILPASYQPILDLIDSGQGFPKGVYHTCDIPFFYYNLRQNADNRIRKFLKK